MCGSPLELPQPSMQGGFGVPDGDGIGGADRRSVGFGVGLGDGLGVGSGGL
jgi:hypothetical protein